LHFFRFTCGRGNFLFSVGCGFFSDPGCRGSFLNVDADLVSWPVLLVFWLSDFRLFFLVSCGCDGYLFLHRLLCPPPCPKVLPLRGFQRAFVWGGCVFFFFFSCPFPSLVACSASSAVADCGSAGAAQNSTQAEAEGDLGKVAEMEGQSWNDAYHWTGAEICGLSLWVFFRRVMPRGVSARVEAGQPLAHSAENNTATAVERSPFFFCGFCFVLFSFFFFILMTLLFLFLLGFFFSFFVHFGPPPLVL